MEKGVLSIAKLKHSRREEKEGEKFWQFPIFFLLLLPFLIGQMSESNSRYTRDDSMIKAGGRLGGGGGGGGGMRNGWTPSSPITRYPPHPPPRRTPPTLPEHKEGGGRRPDQRTEDKKKYADVPHRAENGKLRAIYVMLSAV